MGKVVGILCDNMIIATIDPIVKVALGFEVDLLSGKQGACSEVFPSFSVSSNGYRHSDPSGSLFSSDGRMDPAEVLPAGLQLGVQWVGYGGTSCGILK
ncbi:hypothetical protein STEG23_020509, partial [Scotinomys teguina]